MDERAFGIAIAAERGFLAGFARKRFGCSASDAEDYAQETLLRAWTSRHSYDDQQKVRAWLMVIMCNHILSTKRRAWRLTYTDDMTSHDVGMSGGQESAVYLRQVLGAMLDLPLPQLDAIILVARGHQYDEAGDLTQDPCGTIKSRVARGRRALREAVE